MDTKTSELIAIGVAYGINCHPCMEYHKEAGLKAGLTEEEMLEAIKVAETVKNGAHSITKGAASNLFGEMEEGGCCPAGKGCCSDN